MDRERLAIDLVHADLPHIAHDVVRVGKVIDSRDSVPADLVATLMSELRAECEYFGSMYGLV